MLYDIDEIEKLFTEPATYNDNLPLTIDSVTEALENKRQAQLVALGLYTKETDYKVSSEIARAFRDGAIVGASGNNPVNPMAGGNSLMREGNGDYGGLGALIRSGEGSWNSFNKGTVSSDSKMDLVSKTIGSIEQMQARKEVFAVGAYQFTPGVLHHARIAAGLADTELFTPENQDTLLWGLILKSNKRPRLRAYLLAQNDNIEAAWSDLAHEWASIPLPNGKGAYDGDSAGNHASRHITVDMVRHALEQARIEINMNARGTVDGKLKYKG